MNGSGGGYVQVKNYVVKNDEKGISHPVRARNVQQTMIDPYVIKSRIEKVVNTTKESVASNYTKRLRTLADDWDTDRAIVINEVDCRPAIQDLQFASEKIYIAVENTISPIYGVALQIHNLLQQKANDAAWQDANYLRQEYGEGTYIIEGYGGTN